MMRTLRRPAPATHVWEDLADRFGIDPDLRGGELETAMRSVTRARSVDPSPRQFGPGLLEQPDGPPIVGLCYVSDFKAEEEWGVGDLRKALTGGARDPQIGRKAHKAHVGWFSDVDGLIISTRPLEQREHVWGEPLSRYGDGTAYVSHFRDGITPSDLWNRRFALNQRRMTELRPIATERGVPTPLPRKKDDLVAAIIAKESEDRPAPLVWPGWFQDGKTLVLRADSGPARTAIRHLVAAAKKGTLGLGNGGRLWATGLFIYDTDDETSGLRRERDEHLDWYDARMAELAPVRQELEAAGYGFYALGRPTILKSRVRRDPEEERQVLGDGTVCYWLNGQCKGEGVVAQPFGWYTLDELQARKFVTDSAERKTDRASN